MASVRIVHIEDLKLHRGLHRQPNANQALVCKQAVGGTLRREGRDVSRWAGGTVDTSKQRIIRIRVKTRLRVLCAEAPAILGLMTGKTGAPIASQILEKGVVCRQRRAVRLKRRDHAARIAVNL